MATDLLEAKALSFNRNYIDIYSNSWGPHDNGFEIDGPDRLTQIALEEGTEKVCCSNFIKELFKRHVILRRIGQFFRMAQKGHRCNKTKRCKLDNYMLADKTLRNKQASMQTD